MLNNPAVCWQHAHQQPVKVKEELGILFFIVSHWTKLFFQYVSLTDSSLELDNTTRSRREMSHWTPRLPKRTGFKMKYSNHVFRCLNPYELSDFTTACSKIDFTEISGKSSYVSKREIKRCMGYGFFYRKIKLTCLLSSSHFKCVFEWILVCSLIAW